MTNNILLVMVNDIKKIQILEAKVFPAQMVGYRKIKSKKEFLEKMLCATPAQIEYCATDDTLFLCIHHYNCIVIKDFGMLTNDFRRVFKFCNQKIKKYTSQNKPVYLEAREITSYKILKFYEKKKRFKIIEDLDDDIGGEKFHRLKIVKYEA